MTDAGFNADGYYMAIFNLVFGALPKPDVAPMKYLTPEQQKDAWHDGEQIERLETSNLVYICPKNGG